MFDIQHFHSVDEVTDRVLYDLLSGQSLEKGHSLHSAPPLDTPHISHVTLYKGLNDRMYIRCKIDGEQQMGKPVKPEDAKLTNAQEDLQRLVEKYFMNERDVRQDSSRTFKRM